MKRRAFLKMSASCAAAATVVGCGSDKNPVLKPEVSPEQVPEISKLSACIGNCFQTCPLRVYSRNGIITRIESESGGDINFVDNWSVDGAHHEIRPCLKGRAQKQKAYSADRVKYPMKRVGPRGSGQYVRISWDEAINTVAQELSTKIATYGAQSIYLPVATGDYDYQVDGMYAAMMFLHEITKKKIPLYIPEMDFTMELDASGYLMYHDSYSAAQMKDAVKSTFGWDDLWGTGNTLLDVKNGTDLMICFGYNPMESRMGGAGSAYDYTNLKRQFGFKTIYIEPRYTDTMVVCDDQWVPIRPGTDAALAEAIAYVWIVEMDEAPLDMAFLQSKVYGYGAEAAFDHYPELPLAKSYKGHILGLDDGQAKTPEWAAAITGIPVDTIRALASEIAAAKTPFFIQGWGIQRAQNGENAARSLFMLPILLGKVGDKGTNFCSVPGAKTYAKPIVAGMEADSVGNSVGSAVINGTEFTIPGYKWLEGVQRPLNSRDDGLRHMLGEEQAKDHDNILELKNPIKFIFGNACGTTLNQTADINHTLDILNNAPEAQDLFILAIDHMFSPSAKMADIILPCITNLENSDIVTNKLDHDSGMMVYSYVFERAIEPMYEAKSTWEICRLLAARMGVEHSYARLKTQDEWVKWSFEHYAKKVPNLYNPEDTYESVLGRSPVRRIASENPLFKGLREFKYGGATLNTPSKKIEAYSLTLLNRTRFEKFEETETSFIGKYIPATEGAEDNEFAAEYPFQLISWHHKGRVHSTHANYPWLKEANDQVAWINPLDAQRYGVVNGKKMTLTNPRDAKMVITAKVTTRVMPGVIAMGHGAWHQPDANGVDHGGSVNVLVSRKASPTARGIPANTARIRIVQA
ncbi:MAG: molybdopterin-dependent oxidoreductase [Shewanella sp.]